MDPWRTRPPFLRDPKHHSPLGNGHVNAPVAADSLATSLGVRMRGGALGPLECHRHGGRGRLLLKHRGPRNPVGGVPGESGIGVKKIAFFDNKKIAGTQRVRGYPAPPEEGGGSDLKKKRGAGGR